LRGAAYNFERERLAIRGNSSEGRCVRRKIAFVINSLGYGGAERVLQFLFESAGEHRDRFEVHLILLDRDPEVRPMPDFVVKHVLDGRGSLLRSLRQTISVLRAVKPHLLVSFLVRANVVAAVSGKLLGIPVIISERMHLSSHLAGRYRGLRHRLARVAPRLAYRHATIALGVSAGVTDDLVQSFGVSPGRARTIINPYDLAAIREAGRASPDIRLPRHFIVAVGRLEPSKNYEMLLDAFALARVKQDLVILGDGSCRFALEQKAANLGLAERVVFAGYSRQPFPIVARADFYVSSSRNEGFPNAMIEAMILGKAVVATDCPSGPSEILAGVPRLGVDGARDADFGILVELGAIDALARSLQRMNVKKIRAHYETKALERVENFALDRVSDSYWAAFEGAAKTS